MSRGPTAYLVCYDISEARPGSHRRLARIRRRLLQDAAPVQYSVFCALLSPGARAVLMADLARIIDSRCDDVRLYPLPANPSLLRLGRSPLPEGILSADRRWLAGRRPEG